MQAPPATTAVALLGAVVLSTLVQPTAGSRSFVTIANAANITKCLSIDGSSLVLEDCLADRGAEWNWTAQSANKWAALALVGEATTKSGREDEARCLDRNLQVKACNRTETSWRWDPDTLQLYIEAQGKRWCLGLIGVELLLDSCSTLDGVASDDQNGEGAKAEQTWILLPVDRPQIRILDKLAFPLRTVGRRIVDSKGRRLKLAGVNWGGAHTDQLVSGGLASAPLRRIVKALKYMGFNSVRLSYASELHEPDDNTGQTPSVPHLDGLLKANPQLEGMSALEVFDEVVKAITDEGLLVILTRRMGSAGRCCSGTDGSRLWHGTDYSEAAWRDSLAFMVQRYAKNKRVVGIDILSAPGVRETGNTFSAAWWGFPRSLSGLTEPLGFKLADWRVAAARGAVDVWKANPDSLVLIEGQLYGTDLEYVSERPLNLAQDCLSSRIAFATQEYRWLWRLANFRRDIWRVLWPPGFGSELVLATQRADQAGLRDRAGDTGDELPKFDTPYQKWSQARTKQAYYLQHEDVAPVWVAEFGTNRRKDNAWWGHLLRYFRESDVGWAYGALEADQGGEADTYGLFDASRADYAAVVGWKLQDLVGIQAPADGAEGAEEDEEFRPPHCAFSAKANEKAAAKGTTAAEFTASLLLDDQALLAIFVWASILMVLPCLLGVYCICRAYPVRAIGLYGDDAEANPIIAQHQYKPFVDVQVRERGKAGGGFNTPRCFGDQGGDGFLCCSSSRRSPHAGAAAALAKLLGGNK